MRQSITGLLMLSLSLAFSGCGGSAKDKRASKFAQPLPANRFSAPMNAAKLAHEGEGPGLSGDKYERIYENPFLQVTDHPLSTFSIDVDTASYANTRRFLLQDGVLPPADAVRIEELINYFSYDYQPPEGSAPFSAAVEVAGCPWQPKHRLVRIGLKGREIENRQRPPSNLVFLIDVSGSMSSPDKLPLLKRGLIKLVDHLNENDRVAIVVYAGSSGQVLPSTPGTEKATIRQALERLESGGSTAGAAGIRLAYQVALKHFIPGGTNRVLLCTDGDFNVGTTSPGELERLAEEKAKSGVFLSVLGFGRGNLNDAMMEKISNRGNGNYAYIDNAMEAYKVLVEQASGTLVTIAKDVKIQVEFNPAQVASYRLIGYENRLLADEDFNDDTKDAGEIGAGHTVTALYEIVPAGETNKTDTTQTSPTDETQTGKTAETQTATPKTPPIDKLEYQKPRELSEAAKSGTLLTLKLRYKEPEGDKSSLIKFPVKDDGQKFSQASKDFQFATSVAAFGMLLRNSKHKGNVTYDAVLEIAGSSLGADKHGYRRELVEMIHRAKKLADQ